MKRIKDVIQAWLTMLQQEQRYWESGVSDLNEKSDSCDTTPTSEADLLGEVKNRQEEKKNSRIKN